MRKKMITISMVFTLCLICGIQNISAQQQGTIIYTQGAMTGIATLKGNISKKQWIYFEFDFPNGKPGFNLVQKPNAAKFTYVMTKPNGSIITDISQPISTPGKYIIKFKLKSPWSNWSVNQSFKMEISFE